MFPSGGGQNKLTRSKVMTFLTYLGVHYSSGIQIYALLLRPEHKGACKDVKQAQVALEDEEAILRAAPGDFMTPSGETISEDHVGHFWGIFETRLYMRARYALVESNDLDPLIDDFQT